MSTLAGHFVHASKSDFYFLFFSFVSLFVSKSSAMKFFFKDLTDRKWLTVIVGMILFFILLAWSIWLYYSYQIHRLEVH